MKAEIKSLSQGNNKLSVGKLKNIGFGSEL